MLALLFALRHVQAAQPRANHAHIVYNIILVSILLVPSISLHHGFKPSLYPAVLPHCLGDHPQWYILYHCTISSQLPRLLQQVMFLQNAQCCIWHLFRVFCASAVWSSYPARQQMSCKTQAPRMARSGSAHTSRLCRIPKAPLPAFREPLVKAEVYKTNARTGSRNLLRLLQEQKILQIA